MEASTVVASKENLPVDLTTSISLVSKVVSVVAVKVSGVTSSDRDENLYCVSIASRQTTRVIPIF